MNNILLRRASTGLKLHMHITQVISRRSPRRAKSFGITTQRTVRSTAAKL